jgi:hypothetical protein
MTVFEDVTTFADVSENLLVPFSGLKSNPSKQHINNKRREKLPLDYMTSHSRRQIS